MRGEAYECNKLFLLTQPDSGNCAFFESEEIKKRSRSVGGDGRASFPVIGRDDLQTSGYDLIESGGLIMRKGIATLGNAAAGKEAHGHCGWEFRLSKKNEEE